jgi:hypothetical protein
MENDKCLLCGNPATSAAFSPDPGDTTGAGGCKYTCEICGRYALSAYELHYIETQKMSIVSTAVDIFPLG